MLVALPQEYKASFKRLTKLADSMERTVRADTRDPQAHYGHCLVRFYALEAGCKSLLLSAHGMRLRHQLVASDAAENDGHERATKNNSPTCVEDFGHALDSMAKRLYAPAAAAPKLGKSYRLKGGFKKGGQPQTFSLESAHEAWRYGLEVEEGDQGELEQTLTSLGAWLSEQIGV